MRINKPTYLIAELSGDVVSLVQDFRNRDNPDRVKWPVDITIAGSSGIGTIEEGQSLQEVVNSLGLILRKKAFAKVRFTAINRSPDTGIYYLCPDRADFDIMHSAVANSGVMFNTNSWPFNPHCTLRAGPKATAECDILFESIIIPEHSAVECFSLYQLEPDGGHRLHRF